nr:hypothetical protein [Actinomyces sp.]
MPSLWWKKADDIILRAIGRYGTVLPQPLNLAGDGWKKPAGIDVNTPT